MDVLTFKQFLAEQVDNSDSIVFNDKRALCCPNCDCENNPDAPYCSGCGTKFNKSSPAPTRGID